ncbi:hypothetical protein JK358_22005 [Nocardia sp. 2]|uniref:Sigma-70 family RNA polymerase sigma factor n=1 Tax=Nocardia acididurans TaxID=2802282 RepID=A0ABS1M9U9_9NOCA|nr:hypothetical protein [Nocardia acididurans]MBL1077076.1 hypothetical protein [Nocardia acididurans]
MTAQDEETADRELFDLVRKAGFAGGAWKTLADKLVRQGLAVLGPWVRSGWIFTVAAKKGMPLHPSAQERELVANLLAEDFVQEAVTIALGKFRRKALDGQGWCADGGTSLATYFVGGCILAFVEHFRRSRRNGDLYELYVGIELPIYGADGPSVLELVPARDDVAGSVVGELAWRSRLAKLGDRDRGLVWGKANGLRGAEIAELFGWPSVKAVEQRWARLKHDQEWVRGLTEEEQ